MKPEKYIEITLVYPCFAEESEYGVAVAELSDRGFDSFAEEDGRLRGYAKAEDYEARRSEIEPYLRQLEAGGVGVEYREIRQQNWNALWESRFEPIEVDGRCCIRAPFHEESPRCPLDIVIMPKMSFGTGHHATTYLMVRRMLDLDFGGKTGLDMGCGTGVLGILAVKLGARAVEAVDIDPWACENTRENAGKNGVQAQISVLEGDAAVVRGAAFDFILANINRNILLADLDKYAARLGPGGFVLLSGFLEADTEDIGARCREAGLEPVGTDERDGWMLMEGRKK